MGRIKTTWIKRITHKLLKEHPESFKKDFKGNKDAVAKHARTTKKIRNVIAGYATRLVKSKEE